MPIGELCSREVVFVRREDSIREAAQLMRQHHVGDVLVGLDRGDEEGAIGLGEIVHDLAVWHAGADGPLVDGEDTVRPEGELLLDVVSVRSHVGHTLRLLELAAFALQPLYGSTVLFGGLGSTESDGPGLDQGFGDAGQLFENLQVG